MRRIKRWHRKKRKNWRWIVIGVCVASMATAIVFAVLDKNIRPVSRTEEEIGASSELTAVQTLTSEMTPMPVETPVLEDVYVGETLTASNTQDAGLVEPLIYQTDDGFYMTNGQFATKLIGASQDEDEEYYTLIRSETSKDNGYLFYIKDYDDLTQRADLIRVSTTQADQTELVARDVVTYQLSDDGTYVLYTKTDGNLYMWTSDTGSEYVTDGFFGCKYARYDFSPSGNGIYYVIESDDGVCLYVKMDNADAHMIAQQPSGRNIRTWMGYGQISPLGDDGTMIYRVSDEDYENEQLYMYTPDGETTLIGQCDSVTQTFGRVDDFVYETEQGILYKAPGHNPQLLWPSVDATAIFTDDKRFLLVDDETTKGNVLYDITLGQDKIKIAQTQEQFEFNHDFTWLVYQKDNAPYIVHKEDGQWTQPVSVTENYIFESEHFGGMWFDTSGKYFYYIASEEYDDEENAHLYRYSLESGNNRLVLENTDMLFMIEDTPFALSNAKCYRIYRGKTRLAKNVFAVEPADGGAYLIRRYQDEENEFIEILYYDTETDETTSIADDVTEVYDELWY